MLMDLRDIFEVRKKINKYLSKGFFRKVGRKLLQPKEKFKKVAAIEELAFGLNNAVFDMRVEYRKDSMIHTRNYILRVYPDNNNEYKAQREAARMRDIQLLDIPKAEFYIFENELKALGYRFLILEKLEGEPILQSIQDFSKSETTQFLSDLARILGTLHDVRRKKFDSYYIEKKNTNKMTFSEYILKEVATILEGFHTMELDKEAKIDIEYLFKWCKGHTPLLQAVQGFSLTHGDIRPSNIIVQNNKIRGLIDWEMSCFSDPAQDLGWTLFFFKLYPNLKSNTGFFFSEYWKYCKKYDFEARVYFYEFIAALKLFTYARGTQEHSPEKFDHNKDFLKRVIQAFPNYIKTITHSA